jgi:hypothetical protein
MDLALPSERLPLHRIDSHRSASLGIRSRCVPRFRHLRRTSTPWRCCHHHSASCCHTAGAFRPCGFSPLRRFTPCRGLEFVAPRSRTRFAAFPSSAPNNGRPKPTTGGSWFPYRNAVHTLRRIPLAGSRTASPRPLPSCRSDDYRPPERRSTRIDLKTAPTSRRRNHSPSAEAKGSSLPRRRDPASAR